MWKTPSATEQRRGSRRARARAASARPRGARGGPRARARLTGSSPPRAAGAARARGFPRDLVVGGPTALRVTRAKRRLRAAGADREVGRAGAGLREGAEASPSPSGPRASGRRSPPRGRRVERAGSPSSQAASAPSSSFTAMRSAWNVRVAGWMRRGQALRGMAPATISARPRGVERLAGGDRALHRARDRPRERLLAVLRQDARELALVDAAEQVARASRPRSPCACRAGPGREKAKPRSASSSCGEETPRSTSAPSTPEMPSAESTFFASRKSERTARNASPKRARRAVAAASARGSLSRPITCAPRSRKSSAVAAAAERAVEQEPARLRAQELDDLSRQTDSWTNSAHAARKARPLRRTARRARPRRPRGRDRGRSGSRPRRAARAWP